MPRRVQGGRWHVRLIVSASTRFGLVKRAGAIVSRVGARNVQSSNDRGLRSLTKSFRLGLIAALLGATAVGTVLIVSCGGDVRSGPETPVDASAPGTGTSCPPDDPSTDTDESLCKALAAIESGREAVDLKRCKDCHGADLSGTPTPLTGKESYTKTPTGEEAKLYPPNLTNDETGIKAYSDDALALAIRTGVDKNSVALCPQLKHFSEMSDFEVYSIVLYLRSLPPISNQIPRSVCPPTKPAE